MLGQITDAPSSQLEEAEKVIQEWKEGVEKSETQANELEAKLNQGLFLIQLYMYIIPYQIECLIISLMMLPMIPEDVDCSID